MPETQSLWANLPSLEIAGHRVSRASRAELAEATVLDCKAARSGGHPPRLVSDVNGQGLSLARSDADYERAAQSADLTGHGPPKVLSSPKVLLVAPQTRFSMRPYVTETCRALSAHARVSVLVVDRIDEPDLPFRQLTLTGRTDGRFSKLLHFLNPMTLAQLRRLVGAGEYDLVHVLNGEGYPYSLQLSRLAVSAGIPLIVTVHDPIAHSGSLIDRANEFLALPTLGRARVIHVHKAHQSAQIQRRLGRPVETCVIPHADMAGTYLRLRRRLPRVGHLLFFGRLEAYKGLDTLLDAMTLVPDEVALTIAGPGQLTPHQQQRISNLGSRVSVQNRYLDDQEISDLLEQAGTLVLPYSQVTQSALPSIGRAFGLKLVASDLSGFRDEIAPPSGWLFEPGSAAGLAGALVAANAHHGATAASPPVSISFDEAAARFAELYRRVLDAR